FRTMRIGRLKAVDREILGEIGEGERAERWIGEETPWRRLLDMAFQPSYREVVVDFLSTFTYRPGGVPEIVFSMLRQRHLVSLLEFAVIFGLYWEPETITLLYTAGITEIDDATLRAWWPHIAEDPFVGTKARVSRIRDPLIRYMHLLIATSIAGRGRSREWCTLQDLFYLYCLITERQALGHLHQDTLKELSDPVDPVRLNCRKLLTTAWELDKEVRVLVVRGTTVVWLVMVRVAGVMRRVAGVMRRVGGCRRRSPCPTASAAEIPYGEASGTPVDDTT
ncbi:hypothetical protein R6Q57_003454, partial [Mikania cordata]